MQKNYPYFDLVLSSDIELVLPISTSPESPDISFIANAGPIPENVNAEIIWRVSGVSDVDLIKTERHNGGYKVTFSNLGSFHISKDGRQVSYAGSDFDASVGCHLLLNSVLPMAVSLSKRRVFHASAALIDGQAVVFVGDSGYGKSTLAASLDLAGYDLLTDDCLIIDPADDQYIAVASYTSLRLWEDSISALAGLADLASSPMGHVTDKRVFDLTKQKHHAQSIPLAIRKIYVLNDPAELPVEHTSVLPIEASLGLKALLEAQIRLDSKDKSIMENEFISLGEIIRAIPVAQLCYPRDYAALASVHEVILRDLRK